MPILLALGIGMSVNNGKAVLEALFSNDSEFVRTPKYGIEKIILKKNDGDINFINQNNKIERSLKSAGILKLAGEFRLSRLSFRMGYYNQQSINNTVNDISSGYSFGLGYDLGGSVLNIGILNQNIKMSEIMYQEGLNDIIYLRNKQEQFFISLAFKL